MEVSLCLLLGAPLGAVGRLHQSLDGLGEAAQSFVLHDELRGAQEVLSGAGKVRQVRNFCSKLYDVHQNPLHEDV